MTTAMAGKVYIGAWRNVGGTAITLLLPTQGVSLRRLFRYLFFEQEDFFILNVLFSKAYNVIFLERLFSICLFRMMRLSLNIRKINEK